MDPIPHPSQILVLTVFCYVFSFLKSTAQRPEESSLKTASSSRFLRSGACGIASVRLVALKDCEKTALVAQEEESVVCMSRQASGLPAAWTWKKWTEVWITVPEAALFSDWWVIKYQRCKEVPLGGALTVLCWAFFVKIEANIKKRVQLRHEAPLPSASGKRVPAAIQDPDRLRSTTRPSYVHWDLLAVVLQKRHYGESGSKGNPPKAVKEYRLVCMLVCNAGKKAERLEGDGWWHSWGGFAVSFFSFGQQYWLFFYRMAEELWNVSGPKGNIQLEFCTVIALTI